MRKSILAGMFMAVSASAWSSYTLDADKASLYDVDISPYVPSTAAKWENCQGLDGLWVNPKLSTVYEIKTYGDGDSKIILKEFPSDPNIDYITETLPEKIVCKDKRINVPDADSKFHISFRVGSVGVVVNDELPIGEVSGEGAQKKIHWSFGYQWVKSAD